VLSGTTAISILMCNDTMYVSNVGDSRAIIVSEEKCDLNKNETKYVAKPLSTDQTPYRKDERERLLTHSLTHSLTYSLTHSFIHSLIHSLTHSLLLTHLLTHLFTHLRTYLFSG